MKRRESEIEKEHGMRGRKLVVQKLRQRKGGNIFFSSPVQECCIAARLAKGKVTATLPVPGLRSHTAVQHRVCDRAWMYLENGMQPRLKSMQL